jgi:hypothetical protein
MSAVPWVDCPNCGAACVELGAVFCGQHVECPSCTAGCLVYVEDDGEVTIEVADVPDVDSVPASPAEGPARKARER